MTRKPAIGLQTFPADPPSLPTPPQVPEGGATHRQAELRARALELAIQSDRCPNRCETLFEIADQYLAYINGGQP